MKYWCVLYFRKPCIEMTFARETHHFTHASWTTFDPPWGILFLAGGWHAYMYRWVFIILVAAPSSGHIDTHVFFSFVSDINVSMVSSLSSCSLSFMHACINSHLNSRKLGCRHIPGAGAGGSLEKIGSALCMPQTKNVINKTLTQGLQAT